MATNNSNNEHTSASGTVLQGQGVGTTSAFSTATYPSTTTVSQILYSSATNTIGGLATANSGVLSTSSSGVPSIDTTNFSVLSTGLQLKGNNTNTAPPAGFIGEQIRATVSQASAVTVTSITQTNVTSISLTAGVWDVSSICAFNGTITGNSFISSISTTSATLGTPGDNRVDTPTSPITGEDISTVIPAYRILLSTTTTVYLVAYGVYSIGTLKAYGRISATRVG